MEPWGILLLQEGRMVTDTAAARDDVAQWVQHFLDDLTVVRSANTVRAYGADVRRWIAFCEAMGIHPFEVRPRMAIEFIRQESERRSARTGASARAASSAGSRPSGSGMPTSP